MGRRIGLVMAMEEEMLQAEAQTEVLADADIEGSAESAMLEATDMDGEVDGQMDEIEMVADSSDELSNIADVMEKSAENGGMDEQTAEVVEVAVEGIYARMGVKRFAKMPAMEAFSNKDSKLQSTRIAIEDIKTFIANAWKKIIEAISSASEFVMNLLKKIFDVNLRMKDRATAYKTKLATLSGKEAAAKTIAAGSFGKALALNDNEPATFSGDVVIGLKNLIEAMKQSVGRAGQAAANGIIPEGDANEVVKLDLNMGQKVGTSAGFDEPQIAGMVVTSSAALPGKRAFVSEYLESASKSNITLDIIKEIKVYVGDANPKKPLEFKATEVNTATDADMLKIVDAVLVLTEAVAQGKDVADKLYSARKQLINKAKELVNKEKSPAEVKMQQAFAMMYNKLSKSFMTDFNKFSVSTGMQALNYVQKSMEQYGGKAPAPEKAKEEGKTAA